MSDCIIVLIRHPESESNKHRGQDITETGKIQADITAKYLSFKYNNLENPPDLDIYFSNCKRTHYIAQKFADYIGGNKIKLPFLQEYTKPSKASKVPEDFTIDYRPANFIGRVYNDFVLNELDKYRVGKKKLAVYFGHSLYWSLVISMITLLNQQPGLCKQDIISRFINKETGRIEAVFEIPNCSITTIKYNSELNKWSILGVSKVEHLGDYATGHSVF